jgi:hypothetical protein
MIVLMITIDVNLLSFPAAESNNTAKMGPCLAVPLANFSSHSLVLSLCGAGSETRH